MNCCLIIAKDVSVHRIKQLKGVLKAVTDVDWGPKLNLMRGAMDYGPKTSMRSEIIKGKNYQ